MDNFVNEVLGTSIPELLLCESIGVQTDLSLQDLDQLDNHLLKMKELSSEAIRHQVKLKVQLDKLVIDNTRKSE